MKFEELLHRSFLGRDLEPDELTAVADIATFKNIAGGQILFLESDPADGFFILLSGRVRLYKASPDGKEYTLHQIKQGMLFAEVAIFHGNRYPANCVAVEDSVVAFFPKNDFINLLKKIPLISLKIISSLSGFLRDFNNQVEQLSLKEVPARIASFLLIESEKAGSNTIILDTSKTELANRLGTISETLSRNLRKFKENKIIEVDSKIITIVDQKRLTAIADGEKI